MENINIVLNIYGGKIMNKPNPDDRSDNVEKLKTAIKNTHENIRRSK